MERIANATTDSEEVTLDMIDAGVEILLASPFFDLSPGIAEDLLAEILHAALAARRSKSGEADPSGR